MYSCHYTAEDYDRVIALLRNVHSSKSVYTPALLTKLEALLQASNYARELGPPENDITLTEKRYEQPLGPQLCQLCTNLFQDCQQLKEHISQCEVVQNFLLFPKRALQSTFTVTKSGAFCTACKQFFRNFFQLNQHYQNEHGASMPTNVLSLFCTTCCVTLPYGEAFYKHHVGSTLHSKMKSLKFQNVLKTIGAVIYERFVKCNHCTKTFSLVDFDIKTTSNSHNCDFKFMWCQLCDEFLPKAKFHAHLADIESHWNLRWYPFMCVFCGTEETGRSNFIMHLHSCDALPPCEDSSIGSQDSASNQHELFELARYFMS